MTHRRFLNAARKAGFVATVSMGINGRALQALGLGPERQQAPGHVGDLPAFAAIQDHRSALRRRQIVAGLDLGQAGCKVSQPRLAEVDHGELDESAAHAIRMSFLIALIMCTSKDLWPHDGREF